MKEFEINDSEGGNLQNPGWIRGEIISAWQHHEQVAVGGSVLIWLEATAGPVFLESSDGGRNYMLVEGPSGRICPVGDEYVALGDHPAISTNAVDWITLAPPPYTVPN